MAKTVEELPEQRPPDPVDELADPPVEQQRAVFWALWTAFVALIVGLVAGMGADKLAHGISPGPRGAEAIAGGSFLIGLAVMLGLWALLLTARRRTH